jgi:hypothetical protein
MYILLAHGHVSCSVWCRIMHVYNVLVDSGYNVLFMYLVGVGAHVFRTCQLPCQMCYAMINSAHSDGVCSCCAVCRSAAFLMTTCPVVLMHFRPSHKQLAQATIGGTNHISGSQAHACCSSSIVCVSVVCSLLSSPMQDGCLPVQCNLTQFNPGATIATFSELLYFIV